MALPELYCDDPFERGFYDRDLAPVPEALVRRLFRTVPDLVARPRDEEGVARVLERARREGRAVTPRAAGTSAYGNAVPAQGGILLDLNGLRGGAELLPEAGAVAVDAATRWGELERWLRRRGWALLSYPTSAPGSTVGGWFNQQGFGVGSLRHGRMHEQVLAARMVLSDARVRELGPSTDPPLGWFAGSEGTLGVVTRLTLRVRPAPEREAHHLVALPDAAALEDLSRTLADWDPPPFSLHFADGEFHRLLEEAGHPAPQGLTLRVDLDGSAEYLEDARARLASAAGLRGGRVLGGPAALEDWLERCFEVRVKRAGPVLVGAEVWLPLTSLGRFLEAAQAVGRRRRRRVFTYGTVASREHCLVNAFFPVEATGWRWLPFLGLVEELQSWGLRLGGHPYGGVGLWNAPYRAAILSAQERAELSRRKARLDPGGLLNPGKLYAPAHLLLRPGLFRPGLRALGAARLCGRRDGS